MQATSDKTASANFTQTGNSTDIRGIANNLTNGKTGYHPFYQWGRKDAFRSAEYTAAPAAETSLVFKAESVTIGTTIKTPTTMYNSNYNPYIPYYYNAWNSLYTEQSGISTDDIDGLNKTVKTVYDPCPVGYAVAPVNTFNVFNFDSFPEDGSNGRSYTVNGRKLYFLYTGIRSVLGGMEGEYGVYHESAMCTGVYSRALNIGSSRVDIANPRAAFACEGSTVRPVREK